jgi:hypothetical protein
MTHEVEIYKLTLIYVPPDGCTVVGVVPPRLGWVEVAAPQLPIKALSRQWILFNLKCVILDVIK